MAFSGGSRYSPTMSRTFSTNSGSLESLKVSWRCGCSPKARQMRLTAVCDRPASRAIVRVLQCVAPAGTLSSVLAITASMRASSIVRGAPGRGASSSPSRRYSTKRARHFDTFAASPAVVLRRLVVDALGAGQHNTRTQCQRLCGLATQRQRLELLVFGIGQHQLLLGLPRIAASPCAHGTRSIPSTLIVQ